MKNIQTIVLLAVLAISPQANADGIDLRAQFCSSLGWFCTDPFLIVRH